MQWNITQTITIGQLRVDAVTNSSVLQIGSAGSIQSLSQLYNSGGYTEPAPQLGGSGVQQEVQEENQLLSLVPLPNPT
ncbi:spore germination protein GerPB [Cohnella fermenti]|uniref:Spore gernimation protein n=1 Tax=Cohnella fermenti TaxID=2565925 RepID=A0A4S4BEM5_9BACL|nr:spore germination protein GerPB [Cohnella fermenti]THF72602.1 spore gernimation protein [Cohnella fermenti]